MPKTSYFRRILGFLILIASAAVIIVIVRFFINNAKPEKRALPKTDTPEISMKAIHFTESYQGRKKWELFAASGEHDKSMERTTLQKIRFIVQDSGVKGTITVTAGDGEYLQSTKIITLNEKVNARSEDGMTFKTEKIIYDSNTLIFHTDMAVRLTDDALEVKGVGMELSTDKGYTLLKSGVEATITPQKRKK